MRRIELVEEIHVTNIFLSNWSLTGMHINPSYTYLSDEFFKDHFCCVTCWSEHRVIFGVRVLVLEEKFEISMGTL